METNNFTAISGGKSIAILLRDFFVTTGLSHEALCRHYGINVRTWKRWCSESEKDLSVGPSLGVCPISFLILLSGFLRCTVINHEQSLH